jgi:FAD/FMN-containing dehydrogenase
MVRRRGQGRVRGIDDAGLSRRRFLQAAGLAAAGGIGWRPVAWLPGHGGRTAAPDLPSYPAGISLYQQGYENWSGEIRIPGLWTAEPRTAQEVADLATWAHDHGWRIRARGRCHTWAPLILPAGHTGERCLLVDTTRHLRAVTVDAGAHPATVTAQAGITMGALLEAMAVHGLGFASVPAPGDITLGGVLAVGGHGASLPATGEPATRGWTFGSLSNAILALTAVVWDGGRYRLRTFRRDDPEIGPLLAHLGRAFVTEVTLQAGPEVPLRCRSFFDIPADELFAPPDRAGSRAFQAWIEACGRVEAIWFPFTELPWLKVWSPTPDRPWSSREVSEPYAYTFANWVTPNQAQFLDRLFKGNPEDTPAYQNLEMAAAGSGLIVTGTWDIWGPSRCSLLYVQPTTLRLAENGYAVVTRRDAIQRVVHEFSTTCRNLVGRWQDRGGYPMNGPIEVRATGLDRAGEVLLPGAREPQLSALRPRPDRPDWDCAVWLNALTFPGTPGENAFKAELEAWVLANYAGDYADVRVEWSKGWAYTLAGAWTESGILGGTIPAALSRGQAEGDGWAAAVAALDRLDPGRVFCTPLLDRLMPSSTGASVFPTSALGTRPAGRPR